MDIVFSIARNIGEEGFIYAIMVMGVYISYSILDFPDLSVDGTFPLGAIVTAVLMNAGVNPLVTAMVAALSGALAGCITGLLHVKLRVTNLLSGILVMTALWSANLVLADGRAVVSFYDKETLFTQGLASILPRDYRVLLISLLLCVLVKLLLDVFLKTKSGMLIRATGDNSQFVTSLGKNSGMSKIMGLALANALTALSGSILSQQAGSANINSGTGMVVMGLAAVIIGTSLFKKLGFMKATTMVILGSIIYKACLAIAMSLGLPTNYLKALMAALFVAALVFNRYPRKGGGRNAETV